MNKYSKGRTQTVMKQSEFWQKTSWHTQRKTEQNLIRKLFTKVWAGLKEPVRDGEVRWGAITIFMPGGECGKWTFYVSSQIKSQQILKD